MRRCWPCKLLRPRKLLQAAKQAAYAVAGRKLQAALDDIQREVEGNPNANSEELKEALERARATWKADWQAADDAFEQEITPDPDIERYYRDMWAAYHDAAAMAADTESRFYRASNDDLKAANKAMTQWEKRRQAVAAKEKGTASAHLADTGRDPSVELRQTRKPTFPR